MDGHAPNDQASGPDRPRLLLVATVGSTVRNFLSPIARHFRERGWHVAAAASQVGDPRIAEAFDEVHELPLSRSIRQVRRLRGGVRAIGTLIGSTEPDIVHVHTPIASFATRLAVRLMPRDRRPAVVYTAHGFHFHRSGRRLTNAAFLTAERITGRWTDRLVVINDEDEGAAVRYRIVSRGRLIRMPGIGIDTTWYAPERVPAGATEAARLGLGIGGASPVFVTVGELNANKRQQDAIGAIAAMRHADARLVLLGNGPARPALEALVTQHGLAGRVTFAGTVDDVRPLVAESTGLVITSHREGLARSVMEALALEVPVVASSARGNQELVADDGFVVAIGDVAALATAMDWLVEHPAEAREMGRRGRARMVERYDLGVVLALHERLYADLLDERGRRRAGLPPPA
jgi:glycosyltransferase involved in cell wall biosynthesis